MDMSKVPSADVEPQQEQRQRKELKTRLLLLLFDIVLPIADKVFDGINIYDYLQQGHYYWAGLTFLMVMLQYSCWIHNMNGLEKFQEFVLFGVMFPISHITRNILLFCRTDKEPSKFHSFLNKVFNVSSRCEGELDEDLALSKTLQVQQACTESSSQMILQTTIIFVTWSGFGNHYSQVGSAILSSFSVSWALAFNHVYEMHMEERLPTIGQLIKVFFFFWTSCVLRCAILALLSSYLHYWIFVPVLIIVLINMLLVLCILCNLLCVKVSIMSIVAPLGIAPSYESTDDEIKEYYFWNTVNFALVTLLAMAAVHLVLKMDLIKYTCNNLPFLSCSVDDSAECARLRHCGVAEEPHDTALWAGWILVFLANLVSVFVVKMHLRMCPSVLNVR